MSHTVCYMLTSSSVQTCSIFSIHSWSEGNIPAADSRCKEKPAVTNVYTAGCHDEGHCHWSQRFRAWHGDHSWESRVRKICPDHKQSWKWWLHKCCSPCVPTLADLLVLYYWLWLGQLSESCDTIHPDIRSWNSMVVSLEYDSIRHCQ